MTNTPTPPAAPQPPAPARGIWRRWLDFSPRTRWWLLFLYDFLNAPLLGAIVGAVIGIVPVLHRAFFNDTSDGGWFSAWLTPSFENVGQLFVPLPLIVAGVSLYTSSVNAKRADAPLDAEDLSGRVGPETDAAKHQTTAHRHTEGAEPRPVAHGRGFSAVIMWHTVWPER